ncbi:TrbG/VirB9 family P-type conjugative transfer protein, partial [Campylobacter jejuni]|nr:TrbG/VirB9 family P-type conjugative transfer protein [Campylobacter jejuni]
MKKIILINLFLCSFIWALNIPKTSTFDKRIAYAVYNANDVFQINAKNGYVSVLEFGTDERIINTATGFAEGWDLIEKDNLLFIKPKAYKTQLV